MKLKQSRNTSDAIMTLSHQEHWCIREAKTTWVCSQQMLILLCHQPLPLLHVQAPTVKSQTAFVPPHAAALCHNMMTPWSWPAFLCCSGLETTYLCVNAIFLSYSLPSTLEISPKSGKQFSHFDKFWGGSMKWIYWFGDTTVKIQPHVCLSGGKAFRLEGTNASNVFL